MIDQMLVCACLRVARYDAFGISCSSEAKLTQVTSVGVKVLCLHVFCQCLRAARHDAFRDCEFKRMPNLTACDVYINIFTAIAAHRPFAVCASAAVHVSFHNPVSHESESCSFPAFESAVSAAPTVLKTHMAER